MNLALQAGPLDGLAAVFAVTMVDCFYITLAIMGVGRLLEKDKFKRGFGLISSAILILFGVSIARSAGNTGFTASLVPVKSSLISSFISTVILTISNPLTIVFFTGLFAAKAVEHNYKKRELWIFGLSAGSATFLFLGASVLLFSAFTGNIPVVIIKAMNFLVGGVLVLYGIIRASKVLEPK